MKRMLSSSVLLIGIGGLGVEVAKNLVLAGIHTLSIYDPKTVSLEDLGTQYYLSEEDIGRRRDEATIDRLRSLNTNVSIALVTELSDEALKVANVVILTEFEDYENELISLDNKCQVLGIHFIACCSRGLFGFVFCNFLKHFTVLDTTGEPVISGPYERAVEHGGLINIILPEETRHQLETGDSIKLVSAKNAGESCGPFTIEAVPNPYSFSIRAPENIAKVLLDSGGGEFVQIKEPAEKILSPGALASLPIVCSDFEKEARTPLILLAFLTLGRFKVQTGSLPRPWNNDDAEVFAGIAKQLAASIQYEGQIDEEILKYFSFTSRGSLPSLCSILGGITAQEALKSISGKFHPICQYFCYDVVDSLPTHSPLLPTPENSAEGGSRYDSQYAVYGRPFVELLQAQGIFLVGAGAIGCELLKIWAMMGLGLGGKSIVVTDMDLIEKSNLNRQLLFRAADIQQPKSVTAARAISKMNASYMHSTSIKALQERVGDDSEGIFNEDFYKETDIVVNALDNIEARRYVDRRCVLFQKPLLESGTLGTKCNTQVIVPHLTESYSSSQDPPEKSIPVCTLKNFPSTSEHTIQWAVDLFHGIFTNGPETILNYLEGSMQNDESWSILKETLIDDEPIDWSHCVRWAVHLFERLFSSAIVSLLTSFPPDSSTSAGTPFWAPPKRCPQPFHFDRSDPLHVEFIKVASRLRAISYGIEAQDEIEAFLPEEIVPRNDDEEKSPNWSILPAPETTRIRPLPISFEKDDDTHISFVTAASNLRALNYGISKSDRLTTKGIAGKIIPAIATTTAFVAGLVSVELCKLVNYLFSKPDSIVFRNAFANLALPFFAFSEPLPAPRIAPNRPWTLWDKFTMSKSMTLQDLIAEMKEKENIEVSMVSAGSSLIYSSLMPSASGERLKQTFMEIGEKLSATKKKEHLVLEILAFDENGEDIDLPPVVVRL